VTAVNDIDYFWNCNFHINLLSYHSHGGSEYEPSSMEISIFNLTISITWYVTHELSISQFGNNRHVMQTCKY